MPRYDPEYDDPQYDPETGTHITRGDQGRLEDALMTLLNCKLTIEGPVYLAGSASPKACSQKYRYQQDASNEEFRTEFYERVFAVLLELETTVEEIPALLTLIENFDDEEELISPYTDETGGHFRAIANNKSLFEQLLTAMKNNILEQRGSSIAKEAYMKAQDQYNTKIEALVEKIKETTFHPPATKDFIDKITAALPRLHHSPHGELALTNLEKIVDFAAKSDNTPAAANERAAKVGMALLQLTSLTNRVTNIYYSEKNTASNGKQVSDLHDKINYEDREMFKNALGLKRGEEAKRKRVFKLVVAGNERETNLAKYFKTDHDTVPDFKAQTSTIDATIENKIEKAKGEAIELLTDLATMETMTRSSDSDSEELTTTEKIIALANKHPDAVVAAIEEVDIKPSRLATLYEALEHAKRDITKATKYTTTPAQMKKDMTSATANLNAVLDEIRPIAGPDAPTSHDWRAAESTGEGMQKEIGAGDPERPTITRSKSAGF